MKTGSATKTSLSSPAGSGLQSRMDLRYLLRALLKYNASDLHLKPGRPPLYRINGKLVAAKMESISEDELNTMLTSVMTEQQIHALEKTRQTDFSFKVEEIGRFRCCVFYQRNSVSAVLRLIPLAVPGIDELGIPSVVKDLCTRPRGLILVTGPTGAGKSTTLGSMIQYINETRYVHVLTIEDPIEFTYRDFKSSVTQREVGTDTPSFSEALSGGLRQDPDVIVIGELRDLNTIQTALHAAETGHLVISTLHTNDARSTLERMFTMFPSEEQNQIRIQLASTLIGVISQQLMMRADGSGRVPACEVMIKSPAIESMILKNHLNEIQSAIESSNTYYKMQSLNRDLQRLVQANIVSAEEALKITNNQSDLKMRLQGVERDIDKLAG